MKTKHVMIVLFALILFQATLFTGTQLTASNSRQSAGNTAIQPPAQTSGAGGENPLITNVVQGGGFETADSAGSPSYWSSWGTQYAKTNTTYTAIKYGGSYSGEAECRGTSQWWGSGELIYNGYSSMPHLVAGLNFTSYTYLVSNPDLANGGRIDIVVETYNPSHALIYYLSYSSSWKPTNDSFTAYFLSNWSMGSWQRFSRNVTADYMTRFGTPPANCYVTYTAWQVYSPANPKGLTEVLADDHSLTNRTAYIYTPNGNFESGDGNHWAIDDTSPCSVLLTTDHTEGSFAANMSAKSVMAGGYGYAGMSQSYSYPRGLYVSQPGTGVLSFDWKYTETYNGGWGQDAYIYIYAQNNTRSLQVYLMIGTSLDYFSYSNSSSLMYIKASGFGNNGTWQHEAIDLHALFQEYNVSSLVITDYEFEVDISANANSSSNLLLDKFRLLNYPTLDPGFEQFRTWSPSDPVPTWWQTNAGYPYINRTSFAHSGNWAANITSYGGVPAGLDRGQYVSIDGSIYTDFWYQVKSTTSASESVAYIELYFDSGVWIYYLLAATSIYPATNSSDSVYYYVDGFNQTGTWRNLVRNVKADLEAAFAPTSWVLDTVEMVCYGAVGGTVSVIFDDMNFVVDTHPPTINQVLRNPIAPMYHDAVQVTINATDVLSGVAHVYVYYRIGTGSWSILTATMSGGLYHASIPTQSYGASVSYYVNATDNLGHVAVGSTFSYVLGDDIAPVIDSISPINNTVVSGWKFVNVTTHDPGVGSSGVSHVELWSGSSLLANTSSAPYQLHWNTQLLTNGTHTLTVRVMDRAGNMASVILHYDVENAQTTTTTSTTSTTTTTTSGTQTTTGPPFLLIGVVGIVAVIIVLALVLKSRAK